MPSGSQNTTSNTTSEPWEGVRPFLTDAYNQASEIFKAGPPGYYPGQTTATPSPYTQTALGLQAERGLNGSPMVAAAQQGMGQLAGGQGANLFVPGLQQSNATLAGAQQNPNLGQFNAQAGTLARGLTDFSAWNPNAGAADRAGGVYTGLMSGQGAWGGPDDAARTAQNWLLGGQMNPTTGAAPGAAQGLSQTGQGSALGISGSTLGGADQSLRGLMGSNPFAGLSGTAGRGANALTGQNAAGGLMPGGQSTISGLMGANASGGLMPGLAGAYGSLASGEGAYIDPSLRGQGQQGLAGYLSGQNVAGSAGTRAAGQGLLTDTLGGQFTGAGNPYFSGMVDAATRPMREAFSETVLPGITSQFAAASRYGSGAHRDAADQAGRTLERSIGDVGSNLAFQTYGMERGLQNAGISTALNDYLSQQGLQMSGLGQALQGSQAGDANRLAAASGIAGLRGQDIGAQGTGIQAMSGLRGQDLSALAQGSGLAGSLYGQGADRGLSAAGTALNAGNAQASLGNQANLGLLSGYYQGTGQQIQGIGQQIGADQFDRSLALDAARAGTQGGLGFGGQQIQAINSGLSNALNTGNQALTAAGLGQQGYLGAEQDMIRAAGLTPQLAQQDYLDINQLGAAGSMLDQATQQGIDADIDRWNYNSTAPMQYLSNYIGLLNGAPWNTNSTQRIPGASGFQNAMSGAGTGAMLLSAILPLLCWVAREAYDGAPKWLAMRDVMLHRAPAAFRNWYIQNGERLATWLRANPEHKPMVRDAMDRVLEAA